jgi:uncharacterized membrane protein (DUF441 family)
VAHRSVPGNGPMISSRAWRGTAVVVLLALAGAHLSPLRDWHARAGYLDAGMAAAALAALGAAAALAVRASWRDWQGAAALAVAAAAAYLVSRGVGWPGDTAVIGRWRSPDGSAALAADLLALAVTGAVLHGGLPARPAARPAAGRRARVAPGPDGPAGDR